MKGKYGQCSVSKGECKQLECDISGQVELSKDSNWK